MNISNTLKKISKKNKKTVITSALFIILSAAEFTVSYVGKEQRVINDTQKLSNSNDIRINKLETDVLQHNERLANIVTRFSFNAYIAHTDDRFKQESSTNEEVLQNMGILEGRVSGLEKIVYALNMYELKDSKGNRC